MGLFLDQGGENGQQRKSLELAAGKAWNSHPCIHKLVEKQPWE